MPIRMSREMEPPTPPTEIAKQKERRQIMWELSEAKYDLSDLILDRSTASQLLDVISYFHNRTLLFETWGLGQRFPQQLCLAVNLYGPPGTGKTMAAHAIAKAVAMPLLCVDYAEIESKYVGETSKNLSDLFHTAQEKQAVIFFDEADALLDIRIASTLQRAAPPIFNVDIRFLVQFTDGGGRHLAAPQGFRNVLHTPD